MLDMYLSGGCFLWIYGLRAIEWRTPAVVLRLNSIQKFSNGFVLIKCEFRNMPQIVAFIQLTNLVYIYKIVL